MRWEKGWSILGDPRTAHWGVTKLNKNQDQLDEMNANLVELISSLLHLPVSSVIFPWVLKNGMSQSGGTTTLNLDGNSMIESQSYRIYFTCYF